MKKLDNSNVTKENIDEIMKDFAEQTEENKEFIKSLLIEHMNYKCECTIEGDLKWNCSIENYLTGGLNKKEFLEHIS
jgi:hypothetical protein